MFEIILLVFFVLCLVLVIHPIYLNYKKKHNVKEERKIYVGRAIEGCIFSEEAKKMLRENMDKE